MPIELLIVEDEEDQKDAFLGCYYNEIRMGDYQLIFARTGEEAIEIIENDIDRKINFIICDLRMPAAKVDGWAFIKYLVANSIDIKTIIVSAVGKLENFNEQERKNIVSFIVRNSPEDDLPTIKNQIELCVNYPDRFTIESQKVRFNTIAKSTNDLSSKQKIKLLEHILFNANLKELLQLRTDLPQLLEQGIDEAIERDRIHQWLLKKQQNGELKFLTSIRNIDRFYVDLRPTKKNPTYCNIRYWWEGQHRTTYVPKALLEELLQLL